MGSCRQCRGALAICLSTIGDILRHRRLSLFGHFARLDPGVPAHDALRLMKAKSQSSGQLEKTSGPLSQRLAQQGPALCCCLRCQDRQGSRWRNGPLGLRDNDDDDLPHTYYSVSKCRQSADPRITRRLLTKVLDLVNAV